MGLTAIAFAAEALAILVLVHTIERRLPSRW